MYIFIFTNYKLPLVRGYLIYAFSLFLFPSFQITTYLGTIPSNSAMTSRSPQLRHLRYV